MISAVAGVVAFLLTENMDHLMVWMDAWTPLMLVILAVGIASSVFTSRKKKDSEKQHAPGYAKS